MIPKHKSTRIQILGVFSVLLAVIFYAIGITVGILHPPTFSSEEWKALSPEEVTAVEFLPVKNRHSSVNRTISGRASIREPALMKQLSACLDGRNTYLDFGRSRFAVRDQFNIRISTTTRDFWFRVSIEGEEEAKEPIARYSEIRVETIDRPGDEQRFYGHLEASRELAQLIYSILEQRNARLVQVECSDRDDRFF